MKCDSVTDWTVLEDEGVAALVQSVARKAAYRTGGVIDADDIEQEASIFLATHAVAFRDMDRPLAHNWLLQQMGHRFETEVARAGKSLSYEELLEPYLDDGDGD
jgi:DNA-directed RNA polymerase specialized sigma24 family protein